MTTYNIRTLSPEVQTAVSAAWDHYYRDFDTYAREHPGCDASEIIARLGPALDKRLATIREAAEEDGHYGRPDTSAP